jgi:hypothetical protein
MANRSEPGLMIREGSRAAWIQWLVLTAGIGGFGVLREEEDWLERLGWWAMGDG